MAVTVTSGLGSDPVGAQVPGSRRRDFVKIAFDNSYPTGGYAVSASAVNLVGLDTLILSGSTAAGRLCSWDQTNGKIKVFSAVTTEVSNATDLSADSVIAEVVGI